MYSALTHYQVGVFSQTGDTVGVQIIGAKTAELAIGKTAGNSAPYSAQGQRVAKPGRNPWIERVWGVAMAIRAGNLTGVKDKRWAAESMEIEIMQTGKP